MAEMSSFDIAAIVSELKPQLVDAWVSNVYQIDSIFTIKFRTKVGNIELLVEPQKRIHLTKYERAKPKLPSKFCMTLRKYLRNQRIIALNQHQFDRVVVIEVGKFVAEENQRVTQNRLVVELFERGNLVLLNSEGKVIIALDYRTMRDRRIIPNREFNFAPSRGLDIKNLTPTDLKTILDNSDQNLIRTLITNLNISPIYAEEICFRAQVDKNIEVKELNPEKIETLFSIIKKIATISAEATLNPSIIQTDSKEILAPFDLMQFATAKKRVFKTFNEAADEFFSLKEELKVKVEEVKEKKTELSKNEKILRNQQMAMEQLERSAIRNKRLGDLLYQYFQEIEEILTSIQKAHNNGRSWEEITEIFQEAKEKNIKSAQFVKKINYNEANLILIVEGEDFSIDFRKTVIDNANYFYSQAKKAASKLRGAKKAYEQILKQKDTVELEAQTMAKEEKKLLIRREKRWYEKFHWFISSDNFLVIGGRDLKTNELIVAKYMDTQDIFFHASFQGAPVVVIRSEGKAIPEQTLTEAAQFAVTFSKAWKAQYGQADVYCVNADQVSKSPPSGEYVSKGSFIVRGKRREFNNTPLKLMIGVKCEDKFALLMAGPPSAIQKHTNLCIEIKFGEKSSATLAKLIKSRFLKACTDDHQKKLIQNLPLEEIQRSFPGGMGDLID